MDCVLNYIYDVLIVWKKLDERGKMNIAISIKIVTAKYKKTGFLLSFIKLRLSLFCCICVLVRICVRITISCPYYTSSRNMKESVVSFHLISPGRFLSGVDSIGTIPSALATYAAILALQPDLIINAGTAGGFKVGTVLSQAILVFCSKMPICCLF